MAIMTSDADTVALLERALDQTAGLIAAIEPGQAGWPTPCAGWDVRALFGVEVPVPDDAPVYDRLAGWFGRDPGWTAPGAS